MHEKLSLPAIEGKMGNWTFYSSVMTMHELAERVNYAKEIHTNEGLSEMIQRKLSGERANEICTYISSRSDRFFNSLVIAFYDGPPTWLSGSVKPGIPADVDSDFDIEDIREIGSRFGVLQLTGREKLFALDGQHRLSGIKAALKKGTLPEDDCVPVIFVAHNNDKHGIRRSRELFTTLNKEAKKVGLGDIIALDENDPAAIVTRRIVEMKSGLCGEKVAYKQSESIDPRSDLKSVTTIANVYYSILNLSREFIYPNLTIRKIASLPRPDEKNLTRLVKTTQSFYLAVSECFPAFAEIYAAENGFEAVVSKYRHDQGGHLLYRPVGITILTNLVCRVKRHFPKYSVRKCVEVVSQIPHNLTDDPYQHIIWEPGPSRMRPKGKKIVIDLLTASLGLPTGKSLTRSLEDYRELANKDFSVELPT